MKKERREIKAFVGTQIINIKGAEQNGSKTLSFPLPSLSLFQSISLTSILSLSLFFYFKRKFPFSL